MSYSLESVSTTCKQLSQELMEKYEELKKMEVHNNEYRAEIKKVKICMLGIAKFCIYGLRVGLGSYSTYFWVKNVVHRATWYSGVDEHLEYA